MEFSTSFSLSSTAIWDAFTRKIIALRMLKQQKWARALYLTLSVLVQHPHFFSCPCTFPFLVEIKQQLHNRGEVSDEVSEEIYHVEITRNSVTL